MPIYDSSVLVPLFDQDHPLHEKARKEVARPEMVYVSGGVLTEVSSVLRRRANLVGLDGNAVARDAVRALAAMQGFRHAPHHDPALVAEIYEAHQTLSHVDAWGIALALSTAEDLATFDERQRKAFLRERGRRKS
ncbi:MAG: PIN domain-containing protein [Thermoplasmatota archaeon]